MDAISFQVGMGILMLGIGFFIGALSCQALFERNPARARMALKRAEAYQEYQTKLRAPEKKEMRE